MAVPPERVQQIERLTRDRWDDPAEFAAFFASVRSAEELHLFAEGFNWDCGPCELRQVVTHPLCDLGTALLVYWRGQPTEFQQYAARERVPEDDLELYDFLCEIEARVLSGRYPRRLISYDPRDDMGHDLTHQARRATELRRAIPACMYEPSGAA